MNSTIEVKSLINGREKSLAARIFLQAAIPSSCGMLVYRALTSIVTKRELGGGDLMSLRVLRK